MGVVDDAAKKFADSIDSTGNNLENGANRRG